MPESISISDCDQQSNNDCKEGHWWKHHVDDDDDDDDDGDDDDQNPKILEILNHCLLRCTICAKTKRNKLDCNL
jgi:hypothetical protein